MSRLIIVCLAFALLVGCAASEIRYANSYDENLTINVTTDKSGSLFTSIEITAGINDLDAACQPHYQGYVDLAPGPNKIGLAPGVLTYLIVEISYSGPGKNTRFSRGTLLKPLPGKRYVIDVDYIDSMYDFRLFEVKGGKRKSLEQVPASACKPGLA